MVRKNTKYLMLVLILFLGVGFAVLTSNLNIEGIFNFAESSFEVYFDNVVVNPNSIEANNPVIDNNKTTITFGGQLDKPGDYYEFSVDIINDGTMGAMLDEIIKTGITSENEDFINYTVSYYDGSSLNRYDLIKAKSRTKIIVKVEYEYDIDELPNISSNMDFSLSLKYAKSNDKAIKVDTNFYNTGKGNFINLSNAEENTLMDLKIYGNSKQTTYTGQNLYDYSDTCQDSFCVTNGAVADEDGWITMSYDNSEDSSVVYLNYWTNSLNLDNNKIYTVVMEVKNVSGSDNISILPTSIYSDEGQFPIERYYFNEITNNSVYIYTTTPRDNYNGLNGLRTFATYPAGTSGSITFRLSVIEGSNVTAENFVYEPYVGGVASPNPEYPQKVNNVTGNTGLKITGKNLLNYTNIGNVASSASTFGGIVVDENGYIYDSTPLVDYRGWDIKEHQNWIIKLDRGTYTLSLHFYKQSTSGERENKMRISFNKGEWSETVHLNEKDDVSYTFTLLEQTEVWIIAKGYDGIYRVQLEEGDTATEWEPYKEKTYPISLGNIELSQIDDYRDYIYNKNGKWYIHKENGKITLDGIENKIIKRVELQNKEKYEFGYNLDNQLRVFSPNSNFKGFSNKLIATSRDNTYQQRINNGIAPAFSENDYYGTGGVIYIEDNVNMTVDEFNNWLQNNQLTIYYILANPKDIEITDNTLLSQLNAIINNNLYDGINNITYISNIDTDIEFNYKDNN